MPDDGWITPKLTNLPEQGERVEFECCGQVCRGERCGSLLRSDSGEQWVRLTTETKWRPLPEPKPQLPEFFEKAYNAWRDNPNDMRPAKVMLAPLFDTTTFPHLAVVESEPSGGERGFWDSELKRLQSELSRLREERKAEREAVKAMVLNLRQRVVCETADAIAAYRRLIQKQETSDAG